MLSCPRCPGNITCYGRWAPCSPHGGNSFKGDGKGRRRVSPWRLLFIVIIFYSASTVRADQESNLLKSPTEQLPPMKNKTKLLHHTNLVDTISEPVLIDNKKYYKKHTNFERRTTKPLEIHLYTNADYEEVATSPRPTEPDGKEEGYVENTNKIEINEENAHKYFYSDRAATSSGARNLTKRSISTGISPRRQDFLNHYAGDRNSWGNSPTPTVMRASSPSYIHRGTSPIEDFISDERFDIRTTMPDDYMDSIEEENEGGCKEGGVYPPVPKGTKTLILGVLLTQRGSRRERLGLKIPGAVSYAIHTVNERKILPENYSLQFEMKDTQGDVFMSTDHVIDFVCDKEVAGFIGPEHTCHNEATIAAAKDLPMISYGCSDARMHEFPTFARTNPSEKPLLRATVETLKHFQWRKFSVIYMDDFTTMAETLRETALQHNLTLNHMIGVSNQEQFPTVISETKNATRVYVLLAHKVQVFQMLITMTISGLLRPNGPNEYLLIHVDREEYNPKDWKTYIHDMSSNQEYKNATEQCSSKAKNFEAFNRSFMVIGNRAPSSTIDSHLQNEVRKYNTQTPFCLGKYENLVRRSAPRDEKHLPYLSLSYLYDAVMQYAEAVASLYRLVNQHRSVPLETVVRNGSGIIAQLRNRTYQSVLGYSVTMDEFAQSEGNYSVYFFYEHVNCSDSLRKFPCSHCLLKISDFVNYKMETNIKIPLLDEPSCGYDGAKCIVTSDFPRKIAAVVMAVLVVLSIFWSSIQYRKWKYEQEIAGLQWRINKKELCHINTGYGFGSRTSLASVVSHDFHGQLYFPALADYRGTWVCLKSIVLEQRPHKKAEFSRPVMKEIRKLREMKQDNVCGLVGAYLDDNSVTLITEYCHRGSLEDILENEDIKLDQLFVASLVHDLLRGMRFLHGHYGPHGNLKSSNCVVTGRWVLQVTDYGLHDLRKENYRNVHFDTLDMSTEDGMRFLKSQLWRAPELLRQSPMTRGTLAGDVYAFGIILHEIIGRHGPFAINNGDCPNYADIIRDVKKGHTSSGNLKRPSLLELTDMPFGSNNHVIAVMQNCWQEDPSLRPDFKTVKIQLKKMMEEKRKGNLMDHIVKMLHEYSKNLEDLVSYRTKELGEEKRKTEDLLHRMLPPTVASCLTRNRPVEPQNFDSVTIYFSDIVGFTALCAESTPFQVVTFLDELYRMFDGIISGYDVYKVETIGDAYMVVSGLPNPNNGKHAGEIASMALELVHQTKTNFVIPHKPEQTLKLRAGIHTGPVMAGVVGLSMPRYCLFGDTVNTAARMESNGLPLQIHISDPSKKALDRLGGYITESRGLVEMKGKGKVFTYWLLSATKNAIQRRALPKSTSGMKSPLFSEYGDCELRRRSPRIGTDPRRFSFSARSSIASRSIDGSGENLIMRRSVREASPLSRESPRTDPEAQRRKLSAYGKASSLECTLKGGLLSPPPKSPKRGNSPDSTRATHSLEQLHTSDVRLEVPRVASLGAGKLASATVSPTSSEPTLPVEDAPRVNFSKATMNANGGLDAEDSKIMSMSLLDEIQPMLDDNDPAQMTSRSCDTSAKRHSANVRSWLSGLLRPRANSSSKLPMNGLHHENVV